MAKKTAVKTIKVARVWGDERWTVCFGKLNPGRGRPALVQSLFHYVVEQKKHERESETLLIRADGPLLQFNTKKKRLTLSAGNVLDQIVLFSFEARISTTLKASLPIR